MMIFLTLSHVCESRSGWTRRCNKVITLALFPNLFRAKNCFNIKVKIKDAVIDIDGII